MRTWQLRGDPQLPFFGVGSGAGRLVNVTRCTTLLGLWHGLGVDAYFILPSNSPP